MDFCNCNSIMVVDDEPFNLLALEFHIDQLGFHYIGASSGFEALEIIKSKKNKKCYDNDCSGIKLIFMDYQMPIMDGIQTTLKIIDFLKIEKMKNIPIIACTAFNGKDEIESCFKVGMQHFINKPVEFCEIKEIINKYF